MGDRAEDVAVVAETLRLLAQGDRGGEAATEGLRESEKSHVLQAPVAQVARHVHVATLFDVPRPPAHRLAREGAVWRDPLRQLVVPRLRDRVQVHRAGRHRRRRVRWREDRVTEDLELARLHRAGVDAAPQVVPVAG